VAFLCDLRSESVIGTETLDYFVRGPRQYGAFDGVVRRSHELVVSFGAHLLAGGGGCVVAVCVDNPHATSHPKGPSEARTDQRNRGKVWLFLEDRLDTCLDLQVGDLRAAQKVLESERTSITAALRPTSTLRCSCWHHDAGRPTPAGAGGRQQAG
jgi:hypothetical protein